MQFTVKAHDLSKELGFALLAISKREASRPILSNALIHAAPGKGLTITGTDLDFAIRMTCPATVVESGAIALQAHRLAELLRSFSAEAEVTFTLEPENWVALTSGRSNLRLPGLPPADFPVLPELPTSPPAVVLGEMVRDMLRRTSFAGADPKAGRVGLRVDQGRIETLAIDGPQAARAVREQVDATGSANVVLEKKPFDLLEKLLDGAGTSARLEIWTAPADGTFWFRAGDRLFITKQPAGVSIPKNFDAVIDRHLKAPSASVAVDRATFISNVRRAAVVADSRVGLRLGDNLLEVKAETDMGQAKEACELFYDGDAIETAVNSDWLLDFLSTVGTEEISVRMRGGDHPLVMQPKPLAEHFEHTYLLAPRK